MRSFLALVVAAATSLVGLSDAQAKSTFSPARPPAIPLAVRSPYLSCWQQAGSDQGNGGYLAGEWPTFWAGQILGWTGLIRVDDYVFTWMGAPVTSQGNSTPPVVNQTAFYYTSTRSVFQFDVGGLINMTVEFLSNVSPTDYKRQSLPFSYMNVDMASLDGLPHTVQLYSDITAEWISGDRLAIAEWNYDVINGASTATAKKARNSEPEPSAGPALEARQDQESFTTYGTHTAYTGWREAVVHRPSAPPATSGHINPLATAMPTRQKATNTTVPGSDNSTQPSGIAYHRIFRQNQLLFSETSDQTDYGYWYYLTDNTKNLTHAIGEDILVRSAFETDGYLNNTIDGNFRAINDSFPTFAFSKDFGTIGRNNSQSMLFGIALAQEEAVQFEGANGNQSVPSLWTSYFSDELDAMSFYYTDYAEASTQATALDNQIASDSDAAAGSNYTLMTSLAVRQAFGGIYLTNTTDTPLVFLKEISSDGNVNTVDVIFPTHPVFIYLNPVLLKQLLDPLFINQEAGYWPQAYSIHDIGNMYPNATGHNDGMDEMQPLEECGNMLIMTLAYAQRANDNAYLTKHYDILRQWNEYLVEEALIPMNQISTDDFAGALANQTNLAIKGIIGIQAMAQIANRTGHAEDGANYTNIAQSYVTQWQSLGINTAANPPHATLAYGMNDTHGLLYNVFGDKELGLGLVPQTVYDIQSNFYPTVFEKYGVPLDTRHNLTKNDEAMFAASVSSADTRAEFINVISQWINETPTQFPLTDLYDAIAGDYPIVSPATTPIFFKNRPVVGGYFSILALNSAPTTGIYPVANATDVAES
ncbi:MAG: hypothetical protein M1828_005048 [Chrysothrix sp. TS-e1954]|nr:MAG: hypothetical protein M1828_005048 [Chrysothrix sp. TS-e1954]